MGLAISVGTLADFLQNDPEGAEWFEGDVEIVNGVLASAGLPPHAEPRELPPLDSRASLDGFPYSFIHYLRRAYAHSVVSPGWTATPMEEGADPSEDPAVQAALDIAESHLICHSDAEGFYVPVEFDEVLFSEAEDEAEALTGGMLGSSYRLRDELVQVFENMMENACKYGQDGKKVDVVLRNVPGQPVEVTVSDAGGGIPAEHVPRLTERFYRVSVENSRSKKGTGLGLAIVKHILTRHRARLIVKSEVGRGTDFTVRF